MRKRGLAETSWEACRPGKLPGGGQGGAGRRCCGDAAGGCGSGRRSLTSCFRTGAFQASKQQRCGLVQTFDKRGQPSPYKADQLCVFCFRSC